MLRVTQRYVTDGTMVYPYNAFLDEKIKAGQLSFCEKPAPSMKPKEKRAPVQLVSPILLPPDERADIAKKWGITMSELNNMSPQEFAAAEADYDAKMPQTEGLPQ